MSNDGAANIGGPVVILNKSKLDFLPGRSCYLHVCVS